MSCPGGPGSLDRNPGLGRFGKETTGRCPGFRRIAGRPDRCIRRLSDPCRPRQRTVPVRHHAIGTLDRHVLRRDICGSQATTRVPVEAAVHRSVTPPGLHDRRSPLGGQFVRIGEADEPDDRRDQWPGPVAGRLLGRRRHFPGPPRGAPLRRTGQPSEDAGPTLGRQPRVPVEDRRSAGPVPPTVRAHLLLVGHRGAALHHARWLPHRHHRREARTGDRTVRTP